MGRTALDMAAFEGHEDVVEMLLKAIKDIKYEDFEKLTVHTLE